VPQRAEGHQDGFICHPEMMAQTGADRRLHLGFCARSAGQNLGPVRSISAGPQRLVRHLAALSESSKYVA
jgi:hypothetical protein